MDAQQIGESIAKAVSREHKGVDVDFGEVIGRREDGSVSVSVGGGVVAARAMASFDVGAAVGKQVMLVEKGGVVTIMGTMADVDNSHAFTDAVDKINAANTAIDGIQADIDSVESQLSGVQEAADAAQSAADAAGQAADQASQAAQDAIKAAQDAASSAGEGVQEAKDAAQAAKEAADAAASKADAAQADIDSVTVTVSGLSGDLSELTTTVSGVSSTASEALTAASSAQQDIDGFKTTVSQTYETKADADAAMAQEVLDRNSAIEQSASSILSTVSQTYVDKATGETFATKTEVQQTADSIEQTVAQTYQPKGDYLTESEASASYATKSQLTQTAESITATVTEVSQTADAAMSKATEVEQTASGLSATVTQVSQTASAAQQAADDAAQDAAEAAGIAEGKSDVLIQDAEPPASMRKATTLWIDTTGGANTPKRWTGTAWTAVTDKAATDAASAAAQAQADADAAQDAADGAIEQVATLKVTVDGIETSVGVAQETAEGAASAASQAQQTATQLQTTVTRDYLSKADASKTYATQSQLTQTADSITSTVADTYQPKGDYATSEDVSDAVAQEVIDRNSAISQSATSITSQVSQTYLSKSDAQAGYQPKGDYATGTELDEAIADEVASRNSAIEQSASSILSTVSQNYVNNATGATYATKTEVEQTAEGITQTVAKTYLSKKDAGATYASKTELTQTASGLQVSITEAATAASTAQTTAESAQSAAGAAQSAADSAQSMAQSAASNADTAKTLANSAQQGVDTVQTYFDFDSDGLHVGKRATSAAGDTYETAETLMGSDGAFRILAPDGTLLAKFGADEVDVGVNSSGAIVTFCGGKGVLKYLNSRLQLGTQSDSIAVFTEDSGGGESINVYVGDDDPRYAGQLFCQRQYAGVFCGNGTSNAMGGGGYVAIGMSAGQSIAAIRADKIGLLAPGGTSQTNVEIAQVASRLGSDASHQSIAGGVTLMTHPCGAVCLAVNAVAFPALSQWGTKSLGTVPSAYRPPVQVGTMGYFATYSGQVLGTVVVGVNGAVVFTAYRACDAGSITCNLSWCV